MVSKTFSDHHHNSDPDYHIFDPPELHLEFLMITSDHIMMIWDLEIMANGFIVCSFCKSSSSWSPVSYFHDSSLLMILIMIPMLRFVVDIEYFFLSQKSIMSCYYFYFRL